MIFALQEAIMARYNSASGATLRGMVKGMWDTIAPSEAIFPYITFNIADAVLTQDFCTNLYEVSVEFVIYTEGNNKSAREVLLIGDEFLSLFQDVLLVSMSDDWTMIRNNTVNESKDLDGQKGWNLMYDFEFLIHKNR